MFILKFKKYLLGFQILILILCY